MKNIPFQKGTFHLSAADKNQFPKFNLPEIALIGRSNVGKSSLINHLLKVKKLAKVSSTPGKTQLVNFFTVDDVLTLVDLPGYGFAKVAKSLRKEWGILIEDYLHGRKELKLLLVLLDLNRTPNEDDLTFFDWARHYNKSLLIVFTKCDKLNQKERHLQIHKNLEALGPSNVLPYVLYSIKDGKARNALIQKIHVELDDVT